MITVSKVSQFVGGPSESRVTVSCPEVGVSLAMKPATAYALGKALRVVFETAPAADKDGNPKVVERELADRTFEVE